MAPKPEQLRMAAQARADGRTWDEIAELPGMPSRATLLRWQENDLIPDAADAELRGTDVLLLLLTDPTTSQAVRAKAAADLERLRIAIQPAGAGDEPRVVNVSFGCPHRHHPGGCPLCADREQKVAKLGDGVLPGCKNPRLHLISNAYTGRQECGCDSAEAARHTGERLKHLNEVIGP